MRVGRPYFIKWTVSPKQSGSQVNNKNNIKWILQYVVLAAIICYGSGLSINRDRSFQLITKEMQKETKELLTAYPEGIRYLIKYYDDDQYWQILQETVEGEQDTVSVLIMEHVIGIMDYGYSKAKDGVGPAFK